MKNSVYLFLLIMSSCTTTSQYFYLVSTDFTKVGEVALGLEGPAVDMDGNLYFVNPHRNGTVGMVSGDGVFSVFIDSLPNGSIANGIRFDKNGRMFLADYINQNVLSIDTKTKEISVFAHDSTMNQPNDLAIASNGTMYASDPNWKENSGKLWRIDLDGAITLLENDMGTTNGIEIAPGDTVLYVNESVQRRIWKYSLSSSGTISNKQLLIEFQDHGMDGMRCDVQGNLYVTRYGKGEIAMVSPSGVQIGTITLTAHKPTNIAFGGKEGKTCFVTCQDRSVLETFEAPFVGNHRK